VVHVYLWKPTSLAEVVGARILPDLGHASLEVVDEATGDATYVSYWPEIESLIGEVTQVFKHRKRRHPASYAQESDPDDGYMQRPAEAHETLRGLDEGRILNDWVSLQDSKFDALTWNCSSLCKYLLLAAMSKEDYARVAPLADCSDEDTEDVTGGAALLDRVGRLSLSNFAECTPEDVFRMALAYNGHANAAERASKAVQ
jgi:hypothetical protein